MSDQYHSDRSLYENSDYPPRRHPSREAEHTHEGRRAAPQRSRSRRPRREHGRLSFILGTLLLVFLCTGAILCCFAAVYVKTVIFPMADLSLDDFTLGQNSVMYYTDPDTGEDKELVTLLSDTSSIWVDYDDIPQDLINAAVAIEDKRFWDHSGVDWRRTSKAVLDMFTGGDISGGSTITQQLIKTSPAITRPPSSARSPRSSGPCASPRTTPRRTPSPGTSTSSPWAAGVRGLAPPPTPILASPCPSWTWPSAPV